MTTASARFPGLVSLSDSPAERLVSRAEAPLVAALGFLCFMPYPAISFGNATAIQMGNLLTLLLLVLGAITLPWRPKSALIFLLIQIPLVVSCLKAAMTGASDVDISFKFVGMGVMTCLTIVAVELYAPRHAMVLMMSIAVATLVHAAVGLWQLYSFSNHEFPFVDLYVNQSFTSVADNATIIAKYVQRPFGIFPEPSAMSSSLAPWILLWLAEICGIIRFRQEPTRGQRFLFLSAAVSGLVLIIISQSGHTFITLATVLLFGVIWLSRARATRRTFGVVAAVFGLLLPLMLYWGIMTMTDRVGGEVRTPNGSWDERSTSLIVGFFLWGQGDPATILFGLGAGLSSIAIHHFAGLTAVWSVSLVYLYETGLLGALAVLGITGIMLKIWRATRWNIAFLAIAVVWLFGITFVTSYQQLLPIWVALGWLAVWPQVSAPAGPEPARQPRPVGRFNPRQRQSSPGIAVADDPPGEVPAIDPKRG